jgi:hypothetical protein
MFISSRLARYILRSVYIGFCFWDLLAKCSPSGVQLNRGNSIMAELGIWLGIWLGVWLGVWLGAWSKTSQNVTECNY